jgi:hypothetical protein
LLGGWLLDTSLLLSLTLNLSPAFDFPRGMLYEGSMHFTRSISIISFLVGASFLLSSSSSSAAEASSKFQVSEFTFQAPAGWERVEAQSSFRKAQFKITDPKSKQPGEVVFFNFGPGQGGGTQANVERWFSQFEGSREKIQAKTESKTVGNTKVTYAQARGTYMSGMPGGPRTAQPNSGLLGAILESDQGNVFIRLTGPVELVQKATQNFKKMVEDAAKK